MALKVWGAGSTSGSDNDWNTATNWTDDTLPATGDDILFDGTTINGCNLGPNTDITLKSVVIASTHIPNSFSVGLNNTGIISITDEISNYLIPTNGTLFINIVFSGTSIINLPATSYLYINGNSTIASGNYSFGDANTSQTILFTAYSNYSIIFQGDTIIDGLVIYDVGFSTGNLTFNSIGKLTLNNLNMSINITMGNPLQKLIFTSTNGTYLIFTDAVSIIGGNASGSSLETALEFLNIYNLEMTNLPSGGSFYFASVYFEFGVDQTVIINNSEIGGGDGFHIYDFPPSNLALPCRMNFNSFNIILELINNSILRLMTGEIADGQNGNEIGGVFFSNIGSSSSINVRDTSRIIGTRNISIISNLSGIFPPSGGATPFVNFFDSSRFIGDIINIPANYYDKARPSGNLSLQFQGVLSPTPYPASVSYYEIGEAPNKNSFKSSF